MINYVIACWFGDRRAGCSNYASDRSFYLRVHLNQLKNLNPNIQQITIVVNSNGSEPLDIIPEYINDIPVKLIVRDNIGLSFGAFNYAYSCYRTGFEYYYFHEDDYVPVLKDFDLVFMEKLKSDSKNGHVCGLYGGSPPHAMVFYGICKAEVLEKIFNRYGDIVTMSGSSYSNAETSGQIGFSSRVTEQGYTTVDISDTHAVIFNAPNKNIIRLNDGNKPYIIVPVQKMFNEKMEFLPCI